MPTEQLVIPFPTEVPGTYVPPEIDPDAPEEDEPEPQEAA